MVLIFSGYPATEEAYAIISLGGKKTLKLDRRAKAAFPTWSITTVETYSVLGKVTCRL